MVAIARATSASVARGTVATRCGSAVWSMMPTDQPSASTQMVRVCLPSTFMAPEIAAIHGKAKRAAFPSLSPQAERGDREGRAPRARSSHLTGILHTDRLTGYRLG